MDRKDEEILKRLLPMFRIEAQDHLRIISSGLMELERAVPERQVEIIENIYRESHSLKGAARSVNSFDVIAVCQSMEDVFSALKRKEIAPTADILDLLHRAVECASKLAFEEDLPFAEKSVLRELVHKLQNVTKRVENGVAGNEGTKSSNPEPFAEKPAAEAKKAEGAESSLKSWPSAPLPAFTAPTPAPESTGTVRIYTSKLDALLLQAEEMLSVKLAAGQRAEDLKGLNDLFTRWKRERARRYETAGKGMKGDSGLRDSAEKFIASFEGKLAGLLKDAEYDRRSIGAMVDTLLDDVKKTLMLPFSSLVDVFPKLVRDLSRDAGKKIEFTTSGGEIELDRRVLEEIKTPLIHLVRNCIDHGIETPEGRKAKKKPLCGKIEIAVSSREGKIEVTVSDDGAGIDVSAVRSAALRCGSITGEEAENLGVYETLLLVFRSGVTTSPIITDISGRGLGLAIVREKIGKINGTVSIDTQPNVGTSFMMVVPLTLATFRGVLCRVGERLFVFPSINVERVARVKKEEIQTVENRETLSVDGHTLSLVRLGDVLGLQTGDARADSDDPFVQVAVVGSAGKRMVFMIDEVSHEQEVLVKPLGSQLSRVPNIAGATVLGDGKVVPILNVSDLMISAAKGSPAHTGTLAAEPQKKISILVVEDSITSRTLLKTILESAGYEVATAVDGVDAFTALKSREYDLVVSDVEMPRMNGFDLAAKIRADRKLSELPVVLVTALESRRDRERGMDVGADAYIVKSSFEHSNLLEVVRRLT